MIKVTLYHKPKHHYTVLEPLCYEFPNPGQYASKQIHNITM